MVRKQKKSKKEKLLYTKEEIKKINESNSKIKIMPNCTFSSKIGELDMERRLYYPICNSKEIDRIFNVKNANDYLLKLRADTISDNMRFFRVYRNKALQNIEKWSLEESFDYSHYENFIDKIPEFEREKCLNITYGDMFSNKAEAYIVKTDFGPLIVINECLKYFLYFINLAILNFSEEVPNHVRANALRIAIRTRTGEEAMDFFMDPRGIIPKKIDNQIRNLIKYQLEFIAGHEFSHYLLNHIDDSNISQLFLNSDNNSSVIIYNKSHLQEFEADEKALTIPQYDCCELENMLPAVSILFVAFDLYDTYLDIVSPRSYYSQTHPKSIDRIKKIWEKFKVEKEEYDRFLEAGETLKIFLKEDLDYNYDIYDFYGSLYLDEANTEWRGKELIDRVDYY